MVGKANSPPVVGTTAVVHAPHVPPSAANTRYSMVVVSVPSVAVWLLRPIYTVVGDVLWLLTSTVCTI